MSYILQWVQHGKIIRMDKTGTKPEGECTSTEGIVEPVIFVGSGVTNKQGEWDLDLQKILCPPAGLLGDVTVVVSPIRQAGEDEVLLTVSLPAEQAPGSLVISVRSWDMDGSAAPGVPFSWQARALGYKVKGD